MNHTQRAIELAKSAGYETKVKSFDENMNDYRRYFLDPLFWQALGKALGWGGKCRDCYQGNAHKWCEAGSHLDMDMGEYKKNIPWVHCWHSFIDALYTKQTPDDFFATILPADK